MNGFDGVVAFVVCFIVIREDEPDVTPLLLSSFDRTDKVVEETVDADVGVLPENKSLADGSIILYFLIVVYKRIQFVLKLSNHIKLKLGYAP